MTYPDRQPLVSVIISFRNEARYLRESIESVIGQTFPDWELILVDDGSTDGSSALAVSYATDHAPRIRYVDHPGHANLGISASRNAGIGQARGTYLAFLDGDDVYLPDRLLRHVAIFGVVPGIDVVQSDQIHWHSWQPADKRVEQDYARPCICFTDRILPAPEALWTALAMPELFPGIRSLTVRRSVAAEVGGFENSFRSLFDDQVFFVKICARSKVYVIEDYLARYRVHPESTMSRLRNEEYVAGGFWQQQATAFAEWRERYLESLPLDSHLMRSIVDEMRQQHATAARQSFALLLATVRRRMRNLLELVLPNAAYGAVLARRRHLAAQRTLIRYRQLCERFSRVMAEGKSVDARPKLHDGVQMAGGDRR